jgi:hypothetical protein
VKAVAAGPSEDGLRRYLLGLLPEAEAEALENQYFAHPEVLQRVRGLEDDLLDDYAAGRLGPEEALAFERRLLASPALRPRVAVARALRWAAASSNPARATRASTGSFRRWGLPAALAAALMVVAVLALRSRPPRPAEMANVPAHRSSPAPAQTRVAPRAAPLESSPGPVVTATAPEPPATAVVLALAPVLLRGERGSTELSLPPGTRTVVLELEGDPALLPDAATGLEAVLKTVEGEAVWHGRARRADRAARPSLLASAQVPASRLPAGDYLVTLSARGGDAATLHTYFFRIGR